MYQPIINKRVLIQYNFLLNLEFHAKAIFSSKFQTKLKMYTNGPVNRIKKNFQMQQF